MKKSAKHILFIILFTLFATAANIAGSLFAGVIAFPLYLDSVMTIAVASLCGLAPAIICAVVSTGAMAVFGNTAWPFMTCHISTAIIAYYVFKHEHKVMNIEGQKENLLINKSTRQKSLSIESFMWVGFFSALSNTAIGSSLSNFVFSAKTTIPQVDNAVQGIYVVTQNLTWAAYLGGTLTNLVDKALSALVSFITYKVVGCFNRGNLS